MGGCCGFKTEMKKSINVPFLKRVVVGGGGKWRCRVVEIEVQVWWRIDVVVWWKGDKGVLVNWFCYRKE